MLWRTGYSSGYFPLAHKRKWQLVTGYSENADDLGLGAILFGVRNGVS